jgi:hypothetical protein
MCSLVMATAYLRAMMDPYGAIMLIVLILSCVLGSVTNNNGFWVGRLDLLAPLLQLHSVTITI